MSNFEPRPRLCTCSTVRVDTSDKIGANRTMVAVHGLNHCYAYPRELNR